MESKFIKTNWSQPYSSMWPLNNEDRLINEIEQRIDQGDLTLAINILEKIKDDARK